MRSIWITSVFVLIAVLTTSFLFFNTKPRDYVDMAHEIRSEVVKKLAKKHHMSVVGVTDGMMDCVYKVGVSFQMYRPMDRNEARYRLVDCVEELLKAINENEEIRPYLKNHPFTTANIKVTIFMSDPDGRFLFDPYLEVATIAGNDKIYYRTSAPDVPMYKNEYEESYQDALSMVKSNPRKCPLGFGQPDKKLPIKNSSRK